MTMTIQYNIFDNLTFITTITLPVASQLIYRVDLSPPNPDQRHFANSPAAGYSIKERS